MTVKRWGDKAISEIETPQMESTPRKSKLKSIAFRMVTWLLAAGCFYLVFTRIEASAARDGLTTLKYLSNFFRDADWTMWLALMIPYSLFFFLVDSHASWRAIRWFNAPAIKLTNILPIRASAYILSLVNEQVGKGAMSLYLLRRYDVPGWKAVSTMVLLGIVEIYQLLIFSAIGVALYFDLVQEAAVSLPLPQIMISVFAIAFLYFPFHVAYFRGHVFKNSTIRDKPIFHALRQAELKHYVFLLLCKAPNLIGAVVVYSLALSLFSVEVSFGQMLAFLPVIFLAAALPLPFHAGALLLWAVLFPNFPEVGVFSMIMHTFFVVFNAVIGVVFLPLANRELFVDRPV
jgi:hypothetical protein|tara:strand:+ start:291 stop:1328 length:1038 start_codon:yes stop_codon:yes gene_type:complete